MTPDYEGRDSLSPRERAVMDHLHLHGPSTSTEIREATGLDQHAIFSAVRSLTRFRYIERLTESRSNIPAVLAPMGTVPDIPERLRVHLTDAETEVLSIICTGGDVTTSQIIEVRRRSRTATLRTLHNLDGKGLLRSWRGNGWPNPAMHWEVTDEGRRALEASA